MAERPNTTWYGASSSNYSNANRPGSDPVNRIIVHVTQGSWSSAINWFNDSRAGVSAHYTVRSSDGRIGQSVREEDIAWHCGWWDFNRTSIGVEHEGYTSNPDWFTDAMYRSSARLSAYLCEKYRIPVDRDHIIGHNEVPGCSGSGGGAGCHTDPGGHWNWTKYMGLVRRYAGENAPKPEYSQVVDNSAPDRFRASGRWDRSSFSAQGYGPGYHFAKPGGAMLDPAEFKVRIPKRGRYTVYGWWPADPGYSDHAVFRIKTTNGTVLKPVSQRSDGGRWVRLGAYEMAAGNDWYVSLSNRSQSAGFIIADAIKVVRY